MKLQLPFDLNFSIVHRVECSGEAKYMAQLADLALAHEGSLYGWETGQFGPAHPQYLVPAIRSSEFLKALEDAGFQHSFVKTII